MKHTPGPWIVMGKTKLTIYPKKDISIYIAFMNNTRSNHKANANLIATAPEMLKELEKIRSLLKDNKTVRIQTTGIGTELAIALAFEEVDKVIAKAKGE